MRAHARARIMRVRVRVRTCMWMSVCAGGPMRMRAEEMHAAARGLELSDAAGQYLLTRVSRDMAGLCRWLETLDAASLAAQRRLTIPLIRETLAEHAGG